MTNRFKTRKLFTNNTGTRPEAVIVDIDGTLENWDGNLHPDGYEYVKQQHALGRVIIIVTARDHETCYQRTHQWCKRNLDTIPFVGPFCRSRDDERYASEFKKHVYHRLSALYNIVGAIDDNTHVLGMWRSLGIEVVRTQYDYSTHPHVVGKVRRKYPRYQPYVPLEQQRIEVEAEPYDESYDEAWASALDSDLPDDDWVDAWINEQQRRNE